MVIENTKFNSNLHDTYEIRKILFRDLYSKNECLENLKQCISKYIDCLSIDYNAHEWCFIIKIKKTSMRTRQGFVNNPIYYYSLIPMIYCDFLNEYKDIINASAPGVLDHLLYNPDQLSNLCHISCTQDNIVIFNL